MPVWYNQKQFAEGFGDREEFGETIRSHGPSGMVKHSYAQNRAAARTSDPAPATPAAPAAPA
jgi:hypothetical protein